VTRGQAGIGRLGSPKGALAVTLWSDVQCGTREVLARPSIEPLRNGERNVRKTRRSVLSIARRVPLGLCDQTAAHGGR
jgi:hypothetical protein